jgi:hypothetical protein
MESNPTLLPNDILVEINRIAVSEDDRLRLIKLATAYSGNAQVARAHVVISEGSMAKLAKVFEENSYLNEDYRDLLMYAHDMVDYDAGYFVEPFDVIRQRPKKRK